MKLGCLIFLMEREDLCLEEQCISTGATQEWRWREAIPWSVMEIAGMELFLTAMVRTY